jgi:NAD(P)-dependent dehydrogenase (short-subunit alcohol dehydrogenase family)
MKTWLITGAAAGLGREWTQAALERGDRVAAAVRGGTERLAPLVEAHGDRLLPLTLDVTDRERAFAAVREAADAFGRLDVVVNNAGYGHFGMVEELSEAEIRAQLETNLLGTLWVTQAALPILRAQGGGHIVQNTSEGGIIAYPGIGAYHASKWAVEGLTESLAQEVGAFGIKVTLVEPGPFGTGWLDANVHSEPLAPTTSSARPARPRSGTRATRAPRATRSCRSWTRPSRRGASSSAAPRSRRRKRPTRSGSPRGARGSPCPRPLWVPSEAAQDLVGRAVGRTDRHADQVEVLGRDRPHGRAVLVVVARAEQLVGVDRDLGLALERAPVRLPERVRAGLEHEHGLAQHGQVADAVRVLVLRPDGPLGARGDDAAHQERGDVEPLPGGEVVADDDGDLGREVGDTHPGQCRGHGPGGLERSCAQARA